MAVSRTLPQDAPVRTRRTRWSVAIGPGMVVGVVATVGLVVSMFMSWQAGGVHPSDIPAAFLWDRNATGDPSLLVFLIPLAVVLGIGALMRGGSALRILAGLLAMIVVGVYAVDSGFYVAAIAAVLGFISGFVPTTVASRRTEPVDVA